MSTITLYHGSSSEFGKVNPKLFTFFSESEDFAVEFARTGLDGLDIEDANAYVYSIEVDSSLFVEYEFDEFDGFIRDRDVDSEYCKTNDDFTFYCILGKHLESMKLYKIVEL